VDEPLRDKNVIVVEDIVDSGRTLSYLLDMLKARGPKSMALCTLLDTLESGIRYNLPLHRSHGDPAYPEACTAPWTSVRVILRSMEDTCTQAEFNQMLDAGEISGAVVVQNREVPTGSVEVHLTAQAGWTLKIYYRRAHPSRSS